MIYKKIELEFEQAKTRLTRTLLVRENVNLVILGCIFCEALKTKFEHNFLFIKNGIHYSPDAFVYEGIDDGIKEVPMKKYKLKDLGRKFVFLYDTGENWTFDCKVYQKEENIKGRKLAYLLDGKGQGIWEDNIGSLMAYINGKISPDSDEEDERIGYSLPWNFNNVKYGDFDNYNLAEASKDFDSSLIENINGYLDGCHSVGFELEVRKYKEANKKANLFNMFGEKENVEYLVINKTKTDLLSSLKNINKDYATKYMKENCFDNYREWKQDVLLMFESCFDSSKNDQFTINFFNKLVMHENTNCIVVPSDDVKSNIVFLYRENNELKYYIPTEIKEIIWKELSKYKKTLN